MRNVRLKSEKDKVDAEQMVRTLRRQNEAMFSRKKTTPAPSQGSDSESSAGSTPRASSAASSVAARSIASSRSTSNSGSRASSVLSRVSRKVSAPLIDAAPVDDDEYMEDLTDEIQTMQDELRKKDMTALAITKAATGQPLTVEEIEIVIREIGTEQEGVDVEGMLSQLRKVAGKADETSMADSESEEEDRKGRGGKTSVKAEKGRKGKKGKQGKKGKKGQGPSVENPIESGEEAEEPEADVELEADERGSNKRLDDLLKRQRAKYSNDAVAKWQVKAAFYILKAECLPIDRRM
jgi:hypothetical protein